MSYHSKPGKEILNEVGYSERLLVISHGNRVDGQAGLDGDDSLLYNNKHNALTNSLTMDIRACR